MCNMRLDQLCGFNTIEDAFQYADNGERRENNIRLDSTGLFREPFAFRLLRGFVYQYPVAVIPQRTPAEPLQLRLVLALVDEIVLDAVHPTLQLLSAGLVANQFRLPGELELFARGFLAGRRHASPMLQIIVFRR